MKKLIQILENNGFIYYIDTMVIHYGKEKYDERMECDYVDEIGGEIDYEKGFRRILEEQGIKVKE